MKEYHALFIGIKNITGSDMTAMLKRMGCAALVLGALLHVPPAGAQPVLQNDYSYTMEIPSVVAMESSEAHLYVLSEAEGMAVFRTRPDSMQWLYTAAGMQQRGHILRADIRFAYLFGDSRRLTVLEPTSVMGAFSSTSLSSPPLDAVRVDENLYVALGSGGLGRLSLASPEALDSEVIPVQTEGLQNRTVLDLEPSTDKLYVLSQSRLIFVFNKTADAISYDRTLSLPESLNRIFYIEGSLMGSDEEGTIYEIEADGRLTTMGGIGEPVTEIKAWNDWLIIRGASGRLWTSHAYTEPSLWKQNGEAGNYLALSKGQLWISEYGRISRVREGEQQDSAPATATPADDTGDLNIAPIPDQVIPYPHPLILPLTVTGQGQREVQFSIQSDADEAKIRGRSFYWKPASRNAGTRQFKIVASTPGGATSSTSFTVEVTPFNSPPRFTPMRSISIPAGQPFSLPIRAIDPDGTDQDLVRYLGDNLPSGASIDERNGEFTWTPRARQVGEHSFRVIATDQYGAAASVNVTIRVIDTNNNPK